MKRLFVLLLVLAANSPLMAQGYWAIGYQGAWYSSGLPNLQSQIYRYNRVVYPGLSDPFEYSNFNHGLAVEYGVRTDKKWYFFTGWNNKHYITHGEGTYTVQTGSKETNQDIKVRQNLFHTFAFGYRVNKLIGIGTSPFDISVFKILYRDTKAESGDKWEHLHQGNKGLFSQNSSFGNTFFVDMYAGSRVRLRAAYYLDYFQVDLGIAPSYAYRINNFQVQASLLIGKKK